MMRRRQLLGAGAAGLVALAGCTTDYLEPSDDDRADPSATDDGDWETVAPADSTSEDGENGEDDDPEAIESGTEWEAEQVEVPAGDSRTGTAVDFELETAPPGECGSTCRELTAALTNAGSADAHDVIVVSVVSAGGTELHRLREPVGDLPAGETYRTTERVELGPVDAMRVRQHGRVTIEHVVAAAERRETFVERIDVDA